MRFYTIGLAALSASLLAVSPAGAQQGAPGQDQSPRDKSEAQSKQQKTPQKKGGELSAKEGEWISVSGKVKSVGAGSFELSLGKQSITVEMDDYEGYDPQVLRAGDRVTATGKMDKAFEEERKIEASSVYIDKLNRYVYANPADEEDGYYVSYLYADPVRDEEWVTLTGTVVQKEDEEIVLDTGLNTLDVDTSELPGDDEATWVEIGDRVSVSGEMDDVDLFEDREVIASSIITLSDRI